MKDPKQTIVVRKDLKMRKGKIAAQAAHASMKVFFDRMEETEMESESGDILKGYVFPATDEMRAWIDGMFTKIVVGCNSEQEIFDLELKAQRLGVPCAVIVDNGLTEFHGEKTVTCIALGPADAETLEELTSQFPLL